MMMRNINFEYTVEIKTQTMFLKTLQNLQENTCVRDSFFNKVVDLRIATLLKKRLWHRYFPVNFAKYLGTPFSTEHIWWLLLVFLEKHEGH